VLHHAVGDDGGGVDDVLLAGLEGDLVDQAAAREGDEAAASEARGAPVRQALKLLLKGGEWWGGRGGRTYEGGVEARGEAEGGACPGEERVALGDHPV
jgi:hypothetical protein